MKQTKTQTPNSTKRRGAEPFLDKFKRHFGSNSLTKINSMLREADTPQKACDMVKAASEGHVTVSPQTLKKIVREGIEQKKISAKSPLGMAFTRRPGRPVATTA